MALFKRRQPPTPEELLAQGRQDAAAVALNAGLSAVSPPGHDPGTRVSADFRLTVEDVFTITRRGVVATGRVAAGSAAVGATLRVLREGVQVNTITVSGIEAFRRVLDQVTAGENVGLLFTGIQRADLARGDVLEAAPPPSLDTPYPPRSP